MVLVIGEYKRDVPYPQAAVENNRQRCKLLGGNLTPLNYNFLTAIGYVVKPSFRPVQNPSK